MTPAWDQLPLVAAYASGGVLLIAGLGKAHPRGVQDLSAFLAQILPMAKWARWAAYCSVAAELAIGGLLLVSPERLELRVGAFAMAALLGAIQLWALRRDVPVACGCFGAFDWRTPEEVPSVEHSRALFLLGLAFVALFSRNSTEVRDLPMALAGVGAASIAIAASVFVRGFLVNAGREPLPIEREVEPVG